MRRRSFIQKAFLFTFSLTSLKSLDSCSWFSLAKSVKKLKFGIISPDSQDNQKLILETFLADMSQKIGIPVEAVYSNQYGEIIEAMRFNKIHIAWYGGMSYIEAVKVADAEVFAQTVNLDGSKGYYSYLIMNKNHPGLRQAKKMGGDKYLLAHAAELSFAFNNPQSTSGFLVPFYQIFAHNQVDPQTIFTDLNFVGNHEATALAIVNNQVDIATTNNKFLSCLAKKNPDLVDSIEVIWQSNLIPSDPITYHRDLPQNIKKVLEEFFYNYTKSETLRALGCSKFAPAEDSTWNSIRELNIARKIFEIDSNKSLSQEQKNKKITELKEELEQIKYSKK